MNPLISIVIPAYNAEKYIAETLQSVLSQTYQNWECIIVNDGSTDDTLNIANEWAKKDVRFRVFSKENEGHSKTRNYGIDQTKADYIAFLDSDDVWMPTHLNILMTALQENNADFVYSTAYYILNNQYTTEKIRNFEVQKGILKGKKFIEDMLYKNEVSTPAVLCKKQLLLEVGKFTYQKNAEDLHLWLKLLFNNAIFFALPETTLYVRQHECSTSNYDRFCTQDLLGVVHHLKKQIIKEGIDYDKLFTYWARRYFLLKNDKKHFIEALKYINSLEYKYFPILSKFFYLLPSKILKLLGLQLLKK